MFSWAGAERSGGLRCGWPRVCGWLLLALASPLAADVKVGDAFPPLAPGEVTVLGDGEVPAWTGQITLVDFWASWCAPCKASFPALAKLHREFAARGFSVVAIGVDEKPAAAVAFWKRQAPPFPTVHDRTQALVRQVGVPTMPTSYLLDRAGRVRFVHAGFRGESTERELRTQILALLEEPPSNATSNR